MEHPELLELAAMLPLGTLDADDERLLEEHLRGGCAECAAAIRASSDVVDSLAESVPPLAPSPGALGRLLERAQADAAAAGGAAARSPRASDTGTQRALRSAPPRRGRALAVGLALAASLVAAVGLGFEARALRTALGEAQRTIARLEEQLGTATAEREQLERKLASADSTLGDLTARDLRTVSMAGAGPSPGATARAYLDPANRRLVLVVYDLPPPPAGRSYQLWVIRNDEPVSAGVFGVDPEGRARYQTASRPPLEGAVTIAVTLEPEGGVDKPSGPVVLAGS